MSIRFQPTRSNVDLRGAAFANRSALDSFNKAIAGLKGSFQNIDTARNNQAEEAFRSQIANLSASELDAFDVGAQAQNSRLNRSSLDNILNKRLNSVRSQEEAGFKRAEIERARREDPLMQNILANLNGKSSAEQQAIIAEQMANLPDDVSGKFKNSLFAAAQGRLQNTIGQERSNLNFQQQQSDRQKERSQRLGIEAAENLGSNLLGSLGPNDTEDSVLGNLRSSAEYQNLDARGRDRVDQYVKNSYRSRKEPSYEAQQALQKADETRQAEFKIQHQELNNQRQRLGPRPEIEMKASDPKSRNQALGEVTQAVRSLQGNSFFGGNDLKDEDLIKEARNMMTDGFTLEGDSYKPSEIDGRFLVNAIKSLDGDISKASLRKAVADSIKATGESQAAWDRENIALDARGINLEHNILGLNSVEKKRQAEQSAASKAEDERVKNINNSIQRRTRQRQQNIPTYLQGSGDERNNTRSDFRDQIRRLRQQP